MKLPPRMVEALDATGLPWSAEDGGKHFKIRVAGKFVAITPKRGGAGVGRAEKNVIAQIRCAAREFDG